MKTLTAITIKKNQHVKTFNIIQNGYIHIFIHLAFDSMLYEHNLKDSYYNKSLLHISFYSIFST